MQTKMLDGRVTYMEGSNVGLTAETIDFDYAMNVRLILQTHIEAR